MPKKIVLLFCGIFFITSVALAFDDLRLEGIIYDEQDYTKSIALINGTSKVKGDKLGKYRILRVGPDWVEVKNEETSEIQKMMLKDKKEVQKADSQATEETTSEATSFEDFIQKLLDKPRKLMLRGIEMKAIYDIAVINNASVKYFNLMGTFPRHFKQLTGHGLLSKSYDDGVSFKYQFYFSQKEEPQNWGVHAEPLDENADLHSFFIGTDAQIRAAKSGPATKDSPIHDYPGKGDAIPT